MFRNPRAQNSSVVLAHGCHGMLCAGRAGRDVIPCCCLGMLLMLSIVGLNEVLASFLKITCGHWTRPQGCGLLHPGLCVGHCVWCLVFGVWCRQVLHPSRLLPGHAESGSSVSGPSWVISCCLCSQCCPTKQCELARWLSALSSGFGTPQSYSAKQEAPFNCKCLKLSRNQFPLVRK